jgi:putative SOS response-associated peptidase YedK
MCGRSRCALAPEEVTARYRTARSWENREQYQPKNNVSPGSATPIVLLDRSGHLIIRTMTWGLVPSFTKPLEKPDFWRMFNARSESIREKPSFRRLVPSKRCIVLLNGFFEWKKEEGSKNKQPYYVYLVNEKTKEEEPMAMAGLWDVWYRGGPEEEEGKEEHFEGEEQLKIEDGMSGDVAHQVKGKEVLYTYTILTTESSERLKWLHDRMPVILKDEKAQELWIDTRNRYNLR